MRELLVVLTLLSSIGFYNYHDMLPPPLVKRVLVFFVMVCAAYAWLYPQSDRMKARYPRLAWLVLMTGFILSIPMAYVLHQQPIMLSVIASLQFIVPFLFFFVLLRLNPEPAKLMRYFFIVVGISIIIYFINFTHFPNNPFGEEMKEDLSRGILRVQIPLFQLLILMFFYSINKFSTEKKIKWLIPVGIGMLMIVLSVIRQAIAISFLLGFLLYMQHYNWYKKILIGTIIAVAGIYILTHIPMYKDMAELSEMQYEDNTVEGMEDVRIGAWRYYAIEAQEEYPGSMFFGNGVVALGKCAWGDEFENFCDDTGYLIADVSWAGFYFLFGIFATGALLYIVIASILKNKSPDKQYLSYFMAAGFLQGIASGVWYYYYETIVFVVALYLIYRPGNEGEAENDSASEPSPAAPLSPNKFILR